MRLTVRDRVLLYLLENPVDSNTPTVPAALIQEAIAEQAGFPHRHFSILVRPLVRDGLVREWMAHVRYHRQRRKVYALTQSGRLVALRLRENLEKQIVPVRMGSEVREAPISALLDKPQGISLLRVVRLVLRNGIVDPALLTPARAFVEMLADAPLHQRFVGRDAELDVILREEEAGPIFVVRGIPGIGKTWFAAKACEELQGRRNLFWHRVRPWDTLQSILSGLGEFLWALDRPGLRSVLSQGATNKVAEVLRADLPGTCAFLVFDDAHEASADAMQFFRLLTDSIPRRWDSQAILLTRRSLPFYDRRDVVLRGIVREIELGGLKRNEVEAFLTGSPDARTVAKLAHRVGGHPLLLELIRSGNPSSAMPAAFQDLAQFINETIYANLPERARRTMEAAALYQVAVPKDALLFETAESRDVLLSLEDLSLVRRVGNDKFEVHDTIRDFFLGVLTTEERRELSRIASDRLRGWASEAREEGRHALAVAYLSNALLLAEADTVKCQLLESLGDSKERIGDLPGVLTHYKEALQKTENPETRARLRRKTAKALSVRGEIDAAYKEIEFALHELGELPSEERAWIDLINGDLAVWRQDTEEARTRYESALQVFRSFHSSRGEAEALLQRGYLETDALGGDPLVARKHLEAALTLAPILEDDLLTAYAHLWLLMVTAFREGNVEAALRHARAVEDLPVVIGDPLLRLRLLRYEGWIHVWLTAEYDLAESCFRESLALARRCHSSHGLATAKQGLATVSFFRGDLEEARLGFEQFEVDSRQLRIPGYELEAIWSKALCYLLQGDVEALRRAIQSFTGSPIPLVAGGTKQLAEILRGIEAIIAGDLEKALRLLLRAAETSEADYVIQYTCFIFAAPFFCGIALRLADRNEEAAAYLEKARKILGRYGLT